MARGQLERVERDHGLPGRHDVAIGVRGDAAIRLAVAEEVGLDAFEGVLARRLADVLDARRRLIAGWQDNEGEDLRLVLRLVGEGHRRAGQEGDRVALGDLELGRLRRVLDFSRVGAGIDLGRTLDEDRDRAGLNSPELRARVRVERAVGARVHIDAEQAHRRPVRRKHAGVDCDLEQRGGLGSVVLGPRRRRSHGRRQCTRDQRCQHGKRDDSLSHASLPLHFNGPPFPEPAKRRSRQFLRCVGGRASAMPESLSHTLRPSGTNG